MISHLVSKLPVFTAGLAAAGVFLATDSRAVDFEKDVQPIFKQKCYKCHSGPKAKKGLRYDDIETLKEHIGEGKAIVPGKPEESLLIQKASLPRDDTDAMPPPRRGDGLEAHELTVISNWIAEGAKLDSSSATTVAGDAEGSEPAMAEKDPNQKYSWTNTEGKTIEAGFVRLEESTVVLKLADGREYPYPLSSLHADSREQAKKLATE